MYSRPQEPEGADHYNALEITPDASRATIKKQFRMLALKHHPDKSAPGQIVDAVEFRRVREAFDVLSDAERREEYDFQYANIQEKWKRYHRDVKDWERRKAAEAEVEAERARKRAKKEEEAEAERARQRAEEEEAEAEQARQRAEEEEEAEAERARCWAEEEAERRRWIWTTGENERDRRAVIAAEEQYHIDAFGEVFRRGCRCKGCSDRARRLYWEHYDGVEIPTAEEYAEYLEMRAEEAERRSREAVEKQREQQKLAAEERIRKEQEKADRIKKAEDRKRAAKAKMSEQRSSETARRAREEQQKKAKLRMAKQHIKEHQDRYLAECGENATSIKEVVLDIGWKKVKGKAKCLFCDDEIKYYSFHCPDGCAIACNPCKNRMCRFTPAKKEEDGSVV